MGELGRDAEHVIRASKQMTVGVEEFMFKIHKDIEGATKLQEHLLHSGIYPMNANRPKHPMV